MFVGRMYEGKFAIRQFAVNSWLQLSALHAYHRPFTVWAAQWTNTCKTSGASMVVFFARFNHVCIAQ